MMDRRIFWDEPKRQANLVRHRIDFADLTVDFFLAAVVVRARDGRLAAIGAIEDRTVTAIFKPLGAEAISVISLRPSSRQERKTYATKI